MTDRKQEYYKNEIVHSLAEVFLRGGALLESAPSLLLKLIREELWIERSLNGKTIKYDKTEFIQFVEAHYPQGLSTDIETIEKLCKGEPEIMNFLAAVKRGKVGRPKTIDNNIINNDRAATGDTSEAAYNRLRKDAPELHAKVLEGELSPHAAMVQAGFRPKKVSVNMNNAESAYKTLTKHMSEDMLEELIVLLTE